MKQPTRLPWWNSLATVLTIEWCGAELNTARRWVSLLVKPVTYLALLGVGMSTALGGTDYLDFIFPGIIVMQAANGLNRMVVRAVTERRWGLAAFKLQSGVPESAYFAGMLIPDVVIYLVQTVALGVVAVMLGCHLGAMQMVLAVLVGIPAAWFWSCFGYALTGFVTNYQTRDFVLSTILLPLTFSAPVFYSLDRAPLFLRAIAA